jgi:50S ribosomal protein L16 3-hydroxylase
VSAKPLDGLHPDLVWPEGMDPQRFLAQHWQRTPLFLPGALPGIAELLDPDELAGLACEPGIESRLIRHQPEWQVTHGPIEAARFAELAETAWTLLVQDVDKHLPELAAIFDRFDFIPSWRLDDLMISYAAPGGTVGPHTDGYDVFLIQGQGERDWQLGDPTASGDLVPDLPLQQLAEFIPTVSHRLRPGDALYLPPGLPHHGVSEVPSMTWSIGFRAPARGQLAVNLLRRRLEMSDAEALYADPLLGPDEADAGLISTAALHRTREFLRPVLETPSAQADDLAELALALGVTVTTPKDWLLPVPPEDPLGVAGFREMTRQDGLTRHGYALLARCAVPATLFACGVAHASGDVDPALVRDLCALRVLPAARLQDLSEADWRLLRTLYCDGILLTAADLSPSEPTDDAS